MDKKTPTKAEKKKILNKLGSITGEELYTEEEWARLMWATSSLGIAEIEEEANERRAKYGGHQTGFKRRRGNWIVYNSKGKILGEVEDKQSETEAISYFKKCYPNFGEETLKAKRSNNK